MVDKNHYFSLQTNKQTRGSTYIQFSSSLSSKPKQLYFFTTVIQNMPFKGRFTATKARQVYHPLVTGCHWLDALWLVAHVMYFLFVYCSALSALIDHWDFIFCRIRIRRSSLLPHSYSTSRYYYCWLIMTVCLSVLSVLNCGLCSYVSLQIMSLKQRLWLNFLKYVCINCRR